MTAMPFKKQRADLMRRSEKPEMFWKSEKLKGEITVFLSMTLSVMLLLITGLIANIRSCLVKGEAMECCNIAIRSCFAEYNKYLFERYHIICIDPSYKSDLSDSEKTLAHLRMYLNENLIGADNDGIAAGMYVEEVTFTQIKTIADIGEEEVFKRIYSYESKAYAGRSDEELLLIFINECFKNCEECENSPVRLGEKEYLLYGYDNDSVNISLAQNDYRQSRGELDEYPELYASEGGESYSDYIDRCIRETPDFILKERMINMIEENARESGSPGLVLDDCIVEFAAKAKIAGYDNESIEMNIQYGYVYGSQNP